MVIAATRKESGVDTTTKQLRMLGRIIEKYQSSAKHRAVVIDKVGLNTEVPRYHRSVARMAWWVITCVHPGLGEQATLTLC